MMAYLQMDRNPKRDLRTHQDFRSASKLAYDQANDFFILSMNAMNTLFPQAIPAITANIAFSCEMYLKSILLYEEQEAKGHYLDDLFFKISSEKIKAEVKYLTSDENFDLSIKEVRKAFEICRYENEYPMMACNMKFLGVFMAALRKECKLLLEVTNHV